jgi:di/tricarboxylate transporter
MTQDQILLFALFGGVFALLLWGRFRYDMVAFGALMLAVVLGLVPAETPSRASAIRPSSSWRSCS